MANVKCNYIYFLYHSLLVFHSWRLNNSALLREGFTPRWARKQKNKMYPYDASN